LLEQLIRLEPDKAKEIAGHVNDAIAQYAKRGFVASFGAWFSYINAVGVAFRPTDGSQLVALTCGGIVDILPREKCLKEVGPALVGLVQRMRARLDGKADPEPAPRKRPD
jgi:DNA-binding IclR family transcriptional regulator